MVQEMASKEGRKTEYDSGIRPYSSVPSKPKRIKKQLKLYKRAVRYYNAWYDACKLLYSILQEIKEIHIE